MKVLACTVVALGTISMAQAQIDPSGTWTWVQQGRGGRGGGGGGANANATSTNAAAPRRGGGGGGGTNILVLKYAAGKLTGTLTMPAFGGRRGGAPADANAAPATPPAPQKVDITDAKLDGDTISFKIVRPMGGNDVTIPYTGKISGDKITGTVTMPPRGGNDATPTPWTATKEKTT